MLKLMGSVPDLRLWAWGFKIWVINMLLLHPEAETASSLFIPKILFLNSVILNMQVNRIQGAQFITKRWHISCVFRSSSQTICCIICGVFLMICFCIFIHTLWKESLEQLCVQGGMGPAAAAGSSCGVLLELSPVSAVSCRLWDTHSPPHPDQQFSYKPRESQLQFHHHRCCRTIGSSFNWVGPSCILNNR